MFSNCSVLGSISFNTHTNDLLHTLPYVDTCNFDQSFENFLRKPENNAAIDVFCLHGFWSYFNIREQTQKHEDQN